MSSEALFRVSETIRAALHKVFNPDSGPGPGPSADVRLTPPTGSAQGANVLSWWLYQVTEDEFTRNGKPSAPVANKHTQQALSPLTLNLHYLLTPICSTPDQDQQVLGLAMRWLYENAILQVRSDGVNEVLRLSIERSELEDLSRIWESLRQDYRLSVGYLVRVVRIEPTRVLAARRVEDAESNMGDLPATAQEATP